MLHHGLYSVLAEATLGQESRNPAEHPGRGEFPSRRHHLHGQVPLAHLAIAGPYRRLHDGSRATGGEQFLLKTRTAHRHTRESLVGPPRREGGIIEIFQRSQPPHDGANLSRRGPLRRQQLCNLVRRAVSTRQSAQRELQPLILLDTRDA